LIPGRVPGNFKSDLFLLYAFSSPGVHSASNKNEGKVQPAHRTDSSAILVGPNVKARMEAQHSFLPQSLHDLLRRVLRFTPNNNPSYQNM